MSHEEMESNCKKLPKNDEKNELHSFFQLFPNYKLLTIAIAFFSLSSYFFLIQPSDNPAVIQFK